MKVRIVFDASAHEQGCWSLNDCLSPGPSLNPDILKMLIQFRSHKIAVIGDMAKAFLQVGLAPEDRDVVRFIWVPDDWRPGTPLRLRLLRMKRVVFGVRSSPYLLAATVRYHAKKYAKELPRASQVLDENLYVDDLVTGAQCEEEAYKLYKDTKDILSNSSMPLRKWMTNSPHLRERWKQEDMLASGLSTDQKLQTKVLGLWWDPEDDYLFFKVASILSFLAGSSPTKRTVLQASAQIFDPLGMLSPIVTVVKCLFQQLWERKIGWDELIPEDLQKTWNAWCKDLPMVEELKAPRWYGEINFGETAQLHVFCDSSTKAYGAAAYLRLGSPQGVRTTLVASKCRVAPLKRLSLPRLELMGAVVGSRLGHYITEALGLTDSEVIYWTDSMVVQHWIKGPTARWKSFVASRVSEICQNTSSAVWHFCPGLQNPADMLTRGKTAKILKESNLWWHGPPWLTQELEEWPAQQVQNEELLTTVKQEERRHLTATNVVQVSEAIFNLSNYSNLNRALRVTAWCQRFAHNAKNPKQLKSGPLDAISIQTALTYWVRMAQKEDFYEEIQKLEAGAKLPASSKIKDFKPFLDDQHVLRVGGRLAMANLLEEERHPIILNSHRLTELIIDQCHRRIMHGGVSETLTELRGQFWVLRGRQKVKKQLNHCRECKRFRAQHATEEEAPLPADRVQETEPFSVTGVDFAGPVYVKTVGNDSSKAYIALFVCAVTRAIHIEIVPSQSTESFVLAFKRFLARRGMCKTVYSDNAKTFKRTERVLSGLWKTTKNVQLQGLCAERGITWKFIAERAPWWDGFYERMVRSVKNCIKRSYGKACLTYEELETALIEAEAAVNSRPLTYVSSSPFDMEPLTPAHFLIGRRLTAWPGSEKGVVPSNKGELVKRWRHRQRLSEEFWRRWKHEYLMELRSAHFVHQPMKVISVKEGDLV